MKNLYFNTVLTIIACALTGILIQNQILIYSQMHLNRAQNNSNEIFHNVSHKAVPQFILVPMNQDGSIDVRLKGLETVEVNLNRISTSDALNINLDRIYGSSYGRLKTESDK